MRKAFIHLVVLSLFTFIRVNSNAQTSFDFPSYFYNIDDTTTYTTYTFQITNVGSGGGAFSPNPTTQEFGIIRGEYGISPTNMTKEMLSDALQESNFEYNTFITFSNDFQVYNYTTSTFEDLGNIRIWDEDENREEEKEFIFCWIVYGRLWYCYITTQNAVQSGNHIDFRYDGIGNPYGMSYYDI